MDAPTWVRPGKDCKGDFMVWDPSDPCASAIQGTRRKAKYLAILEFWGFMTISKVDVET